MSHQPPPSSGPSSDDDVPWDRLGRFLAGEVTAEEEAHFRRWLAADPRREALVAELNDVWAATEPGHPSRDPDQVLMAIRHRDATFVHDIADHYRFAGLHPEPIVPARRGARQKLAASAVAAAAIAVALGGWWTMRPVRPSTTHSVAQSTSQVEHQTARGQRLVITLPDGSTVMLGPKSVLRYAAGYGVASRAVELDGDAYFDVLHDDSHPFIVRAGNAVARDIGTKFVMHSRDGAAVAVAVREGRVALGGADRAIPDAIILAANDVGRVDSTGKASVQRGATLDRYLGWTEGRLVFDATSLATVAEELSRWYDVDVELEGTGLAERQLTATFHNESITTVLPMIEASLGLTLKTQGRHYVLSSR